MNTSINKKVICVKDIPSNLIEEAIFILKTDSENITNEKINLMRKEIILKETEELVQEYEDEFEKIEIEDEEIEIKYNKDLKIKIVLVGILITCLGYLISLII